MSRAASKQIRETLKDTLNNSGTFFKPVLQAKLTVNQPGDEYEQEADAMADKVMRMQIDKRQSFFSPATTIHRKCKHCEDEEKVHRKESDVEANVTPGTENYLSSLSGGASLSDTERNFFESGMDADFSNVKIHTNTTANESAESLNALAYTSGNNIVFNANQYQPSTETGKRLLAHELTHTIQQGSVIRRQPKTKVELSKEVSTLQYNIWIDPVYLKLKPESRLRVQRIIQLLKAKPLGDDKGQRNYYLKKLKIALSTPFNGIETGKEEYGCSAGAEKQNKEEVEGALKFEDKYWGGAYSDVDEEIVGGQANKIERIGEQNKKFYVDRSDAANIRVYMKVKLNGKPEEVSKIKQLEDAIERAVSMTTKGYHLDIDFVDASGPDVFEFSVNFCEWANSGNWASSPITLSHEVHHALGLKDRYDYIENHAANPDMNVPMRLVWFEEELKKTGPNNPNSKMADSSNPLLNDDVCTVAFEAGPARENCIAERAKFNPAGSPPIP